LSFFAEKDGHPVGITIGYIFNRVGEEVLIDPEGDGQWYSFGFVESIDPRIDFATIRLHEK
jgi:hypothetical protein